MFEIGNSLREARVRRGLDFAQAELATKIRGKYLRALEDEQFELLPAETYVKGFLRTYAEYLGLDGQLYVDEYNSRFVTGEEHEPRVRRSAARPQKRQRRLETNVVLIALGAIAVLTVIVISAWKAGGGNGNTPPAVTTTGAPARTTRPAAPLLELTAIRGATHVIAHKGTTVGGAIAFDGTLQAGDAPMALRGRSLWLYIDAPENLRIEVRGRVVHVGGLRPRTIVVTRTGWHPAS